MSHLIHLNPSSSIFWFFSALQQFVLSNFELAVKLGESALQVTKPPEVALIIYIFLARCNQKLKNYSQSIYYFVRAVHLGVGRCYFYALLDIFKNISLSDIAELQILLRNVQTIAQNKDDYANLDSNLQSNLDISIIKILKTILYTMKCTLAQNDE